jgi:hypothetical protein
VSTTGYLFELARSTGEPVGTPDTARDREISYQVNGIHTASMSIGLGDAIASECVPGLTRLRVRRAYSAPEVAANPSLAGQRQTIYYGVLPPTGMTEDADGETITMQFQDPRLALSERWTLGTETFTAVDQGTLINSLVSTQNARSNGDTFLATSSDTTGTLRTITYDRRRVSDALNDLVRLVDGPDIDCEVFDGYAATGSRKMGTLRVRARQGTDKPNAAFTYGHDLGSNCQNMTRNYRAVVTAATVTGTDAATGAPITDTYDVSASSLYGLREDYASDADRTSLSFAQFRTRGIVEALKVPREIITIDNPTIEAPQPFRDYGLGDTVRAHCRKGSMVFTDRALRVHRIQIKVDQQGNPRTTLTVAEL